MADVTLTSQAKGDGLRIGIRWRSGASELIVTRRNFRPSTGLPLSYCEDLWKLGAGEQPGKVKGAA
jgi:hypothetical protein